jgi:hypothetical protein
MSDNYNVSNQPEGFNPNLAKHSKEQALKEARADLDAIIQIPPGYIEVQLSTRGLVGAPARFHVRNFSTEDLMNLGLSDDTDRYDQMIKMLQSVIFEQNVRIEYFHEKEVIELLLFMYETFYTEVFPEQKWLLTDEDYEYMAEESGGEDTDEYRARIRAIERGDHKPVFDINIATDLEYFEITKETFKATARITRKFNNEPFTCSFGLPTVGDILVLKHFINHVFSEKDRRFASLSETLKFRQDAEERWRKGENINLRSLPIIPQTELNKLKEYEIEKSLFAITASKALHLKEFNGQDVSKAPLEERIKFAEDPRLDHATFKQIEDHFKSLNFGLKEEITARDPITGKIVKQKYSFQLDTILTAFHSSRPSDTVLTFE